MTDKISLGWHYCDRETEKAIHVNDRTGEDLWIPKSQIHDNSEVWKAHQKGDVVVMQWWAEKKGLI
jgi:hypothetical protein